MKKNAQKGSSVLVMGVGRSGTTAVYALLQEIMSDAIPGEVDYVYEPFLWDREVFNRPYSEITDEFRYSESVAVDGIYHHKSIPLFVGEHTMVDERSIEWLQSTLTASYGKRHYLGKMIRGNGRIRLIRSLAPAMKVIFLIRNPVDVLNSSSQMFSFYGSEFHRSDFTRFRDEVAGYFGQEFRGAVPDRPQVAAEYAYWYFMNRAFLDYAKQYPTDVLSIAYEELELDRDGVVNSICEFLGFQCKPRYLSNSEQQVGEVRRANAGLSKGEFDYLSSKLDDYGDLLHSVDLSASVRLPDVVRTANWLSESPEGEAQPHYNAYYSARERNRIQGQLDRMKSRLGVLEDNLAETQRFLDELGSSKRLRAVNWLLAPWDRLRKRVLGGTDHETAGGR